MGQNPGCATAGASRPGGGRAFIAWLTFLAGIGLGVAPPASYLEMGIEGQIDRMFAILGLFVGIIAMAWAALFAVLVTVGVGTLLVLLIPFLILSVVFRLGFLLFKVVALVMFIGFLGWLF